MVEGIRAVDVQEPPGTLRSLRGGALLVEAETAPWPPPWVVPGGSLAAGCLHAALAQAIRAARRWEGAGPVGVRAWLVRRGHLVSITGPTVWRQPTVAQCLCLDEKHAPPEAGSWCGLYAVRPEAAARQLSLRPVPLAWAVGVVSLYGRVMRHRYGWRAEYARIREVWWLAEPDGPTPRTDLYPGVTWHRVEAW